MRLARQRELLWREGTSGRKRSQGDGVAIKWSDDHVMAMRSLSVAQAHLSALLDAVKAAEEVEISGVP